MAKRAREQAVKERRDLKRAKKEEKKEEAAAERAAAKAEQPEDAGRDDETVEPAPAQPPE